MVKYSFSADNANRLVIIRGGKKIVAPGRFNIGRENNLSYWLNAPPAWRRKFGLPGKIEFAGNWRLNDAGDLELDLVRDPRQLAGDKIVLKSELISAEGDNLVFGLKSEDASGRNEFRILKLSGCWSSDASNNLSFRVDKSGDPDILLLGSGWRLNDDQKITYVWERNRLKSGAKHTRTLTFEGRWRITADEVLSYEFSTGSRSRFDFRAQIGSPNVYPQQGKIKYRLGAGVKTDGGSSPKVISLYGTWKFNRALGLVFEMDYGEGSFRSLEFGSDINLTRKDKVVLSLVGRERRSLGVSVTFSHRFLKELDARAYLKFKALREEKSVDAGVNIPF